MDWEFGTDIYMLLYLKQKTNKDVKYLKKKKNIVRKSPVNRNLNQIELGNQKGELSCPEITAEPQMKKDSASEKLWPRVYSCPPTSVSLYGSVHIPFLCGDLHVAHQGGRSQIAILSCSQINPSLLEKYLTVYSFQVNKGYFTTPWSVGPDATYFKETTSDISKAHKGLWHTCLDIRL